MTNDNTKTALEQVKRWLSGESKMPKAGVAGGALLDVILELDERLRKIEKEKEFHNAVAMKRLEEGYVATDTTKAEIVELPDDTFDELCRLNDKPATWERSTVDGIKIGSTTFKRCAK